MSNASARILVVGGGGREHALAWKLAHCRGVDEVLVAPGNAGTATEWHCRNVDVAADDLAGLLQLAQAEEVALTVVGPEAPLAAGIADRFQAEGLRLFGPSRAAARLEASKVFSKALLTRHGIPTAAYRSFDAAGPAREYVRTKGAPIVVKADGLAAGKGVVVATSVEEAQSAVTAMFAGRFGAAGAHVIIEDLLVGEEATYIVVASGTDYVPLASSQDHKRALDDDKGPNTGGMGAYSPAPVVSRAVEARIRSRIIEPTLRALAAAGTPFTGFLYAGLMIDAAGDPSVVEFNVRLGDPEAQPLLMRLDSDLLELLDAAVDGRLVDVATPRWKPEAALGVVMAAAGYPAAPRKGDRIAGLDAGAADGQKVFQAGTRRDAAGHVVTSGGRVLCVCALGRDLYAAAQGAYRRVATIHFEGAHFRHDIGHRALPPPTTRDST
ncbi:MAG TPA: phosphoribosylamine--glycine ligase [Nevskiaceae bacterium]